MIIQPRGYDRESLSAALMVEIKRRVEIIAARYNCSKSFVIATILADALNIEGQPNYATYKSKKSSSHTRRTNKA